MAASTDVQTSDGATIAISAALPATVTPTGYAALTYTTISKVTAIPAFGTAYNSVNFTPLATDGQEDFKGSRTTQTLSLPMGYAPGDPGQVLLETAVDDRDRYSFKVTLQDGTIKYFTGRVMSLQTEIGGVDTVTTATAEIAIKSGSIKTAYPA